MRFKITNDSLLSFDLIDTETRQVIYTFKDKQVALDMCQILNKMFSKEIQ